jgi:hypothetical protein
MSDERLQAHAKKTQVIHVYRAPAGDQLVSIGLDGSLRVVDAATRTLVAERAAFEAHDNEELAELFFHPDGARAITVSRGAIRVWRRDDWSLVHDLRRWGVACAALHPEGALLTPHSGSRVQLDLWNLDEGRLISSPLLEFQARILAVRSDGIAIGSGGDDLHLWDTRKLNRRPLVKASLPRSRQGVRAIHPTADGKHVIAANYGSVHVWAWRDEWIEEGETTERWGQPERWTWKDDRHPADCRSFTWRGKPDRVIAARGGAQVILLSDPSRFVLGTDAGVAIHTLAPRAPERKLKGSSRGADAIALDAREEVVAAVRGQEVAAWSLRTGERVLARRIAASPSSRLRKGHLAIAGDHLVVGDVAGGLTFVPVR